MTGEFGAATDLDSVTSDWTRAVVSRSGEALVMYSTSFSGELRSVRRAPGGAFGAPQVVSCPARRGQALGVALSPGGDGRAVWEDHEADVAYVSSEAQAPAPNPPACPQPPQPPIPKPGPPPPGLQVGKRFRLTQAGRLGLSASCYTRCRLSATGSIRIAGRRGKLGVDVKRGPMAYMPGTVAFELPRSVRLEVQRALAGGAAVTGRLWIGARTKAGREERALASGPVRRAKRKGGR